MNADAINKRTVGFDKFQMEAKSLGIYLSNADYDALLLLFEKKEFFNKLRGVPEIDYDQAIKHLTPILSKNDDRSTHSGKGVATQPKQFRIVWTLSRLAKQRAEQL